MSKKITPRTLQGFFDYLPHEMTLRQYVSDTWRQIFEKYGYGRLETPCLEYAEILSGKYGEEEKLIYNFEDRGGRKVALRYDHTVPLARAIAQHQNQIKLPFKRYEIAKVWRADAARKGRKREFYQCDVDIVGTKSTLSDAEIIFILHEGFNALDLKKHQILINNRKVLNGFIRYLNIPNDKGIEVYRSVDKFDKIGLKGVQNELQSRGVPTKAIPKILNFIKYHGQNPKAVIDHFAKMLNQDEEAQQGIEELRELVKHLKDYGVSQKNYQITPCLVRGLDYYTGIVFEVVIPEYSRTSLAGGGRYDDLCTLFLGKQIPALGVAVGFEPICLALQEMKKGPKNLAPSQVLVTIFNPELVPESLKLAHLLRENNVKTTLYYDPTHKLGKQFEYADKNQIPFAIVLGPDEKKQKKVVLKDLNTGKQSKLSVPSLIKKLRV